MADTIRLTVISGPHKNDRYCFRGQFECDIGRAKDCYVNLSGTDRDRLISRRHCHLDIDGPCMRVRDLHSSNGTFINGKPIDECEEDRIALLESLRSDTHRAKLEHGDVLTIGGTSLMVEVMDCSGEDHGEGCANESPSDSAHHRFPLKNCPQDC